MTVTTVATLTLSLSSAPLDQGHTIDTTFPSLSFLTHPSQEMVEHFIRELSTCSCHVFGLKERKVKAIHTSQPELDLDSLLPFPPSLRAEHEVKSSPRSRMVALFLFRGKHTLRFLLFLVSSSGFFSFAECSTATWSEPWGAVELN